MTSLAPRTLTDEQRAVRVEVVRDQVELMKRYGAATGDRQHARWLLKEVIYRVWEQPQIPPPRIGKYSLWSPRARERLADCKPARRLEPWRRPVVEVQGRGIHSERVRRSLRGPT